LGNQVVIEGLLRDEPTEFALLIESKDELFTSLHHFLPEEFPTIGKTYPFGRRRIGLLEVEMRLVNPRQ
jgi:hypothetical protein